MRKIIICCTLLLLTATYVWSDTSLQQTITLLKQALLNQNMTTIDQHIDLKAIVRGKIKKLTSQTKKESSLTARSAGKVVDFTEPILTELACRYIRKEYAASSSELRRSYLNSLKINKIGGTSQSGYATGQFLGSPATLIAIKSGHQWTIVDVVSPVIDSEIKEMVQHLGQKQ